MLTLLRAQRGKIMQFRKLAENSHGKQGAHGMCTSSAHRRRPLAGATYAAPGQLLIAVLLYFAARMSLPS
jgi:hypothetical protein